MYNLYEEVKGGLKFLAISGVRIKIMISLNEGTKNLSDLRDELGLRSSTILHAMSELEKQNLVFKEGEYYFLSQIGKILTLKLIDVMKTIAAVNRYEKLWLDHIIEGIPEDLLKNIGDLSDSVLLEAEATDIFKPHGTYAQLLLGSKEIKGISSIFSPIM